MINPRSFIDPNAYPVKSESNIPEKVLDVFEGSILADLRVLDPVYRGCLLAADQLIFNIESGAFASLRRKDMFQMDNFQMFRTILLTLLLALVLVLSSQSPAL